MLYIISSFSKSQKFKMLLKKFKLFLLLFLFFFKLTLFPFLHFLLVYWNDVFIEESCIIKNRFKFSPLKGRKLWYLYRKKNKSFFIKINVWYFVPIYLKYESTTWHKHKLNNRCRKQIAVWKLLNL